MLPEYERSFHQTWRAACKGHEFSDHDDPCLSVTAYQHTNPLGLPHMVIVGICRSLADGVKVRADRDAWWDGHSPLVFLVSNSLNQAELQRAAIALFDRIQRAIGELVEPEVFNYHG